MVGYLQYTFSDPTYTGTHTVKIYHVSLCKIKDKGPRLKGKHSIAARDDCTKLKVDIKPKSHSSF